MALMLGIVVARADQNSDAQALLERANAAYLTADSSSGAERLLLMHEVRTILDRIVDEYPSSDLAVQIVLGESVGLIDIAEVEAELASVPYDPGGYRPIHDPRAAEEAEAAMRLDFEQRREIQRRLNLIGFNTRGVDGVFGRGTRGAIAAWQSRYEWPATGYIDEFQLGALVSESDAAFAQWQSEAAKRAVRSRDDRGNRRPAGRYIGSDGCLREANGDRVPSYSLKCDVKGLLHLD